MVLLQEDGNYKLAHAKMFSTLQQLQAMGAAVPLEFRQALALLHSYVLVKSLLAVGDHTGAARMLVRVAGNISRWGPPHMHLCAPPARSHVMVAAVSAAVLRRCCRPVML